MKALRGFVLLLAMYGGSIHADPLVHVKEVISSVVEDMRHATGNNFVGQRIYDDSRCRLKLDRAHKLARAASLLEARHPGWKLKVWDCYRSPAAHQRLWETWVERVRRMHPGWDDEAIEREAGKYVGRRGSRHSNGGTVDLTLVDERGREVEMPTDFDDFSSRAWSDAPTTRAAAANRALLREVMMAAGFTPIKTEWWHFDG